MKIVALLWNIGLFLFTGFVLLTDGPPKGVAYIVFTVWLLLTLIFSAVVISRSGASDGRSSMGTAINIAAIICNIVFFGFVWWALVDQYPHPQEPGFIEFVVLMVLIPILNVVVLLRSRTKQLQATPGSPLT
jgi:hypothetical protein